MIYLQLDSMLQLFRLDDDEITLRALHLWEALLAGPAQTVPESWVGALVAHLGTFRFHAQPDIATMAASLEHRCCGR
jgi:hypothetical protein